MKRIAIITACSLALTASSAFAQTTDSHRDHAGLDQVASGVPTAGEIAPAGPRGGHLAQTGNLQIETIVSHDGMQMFVYDRAGEPVSIDQSRGVVSVRVQGVAKRYRYDLLPDSKGSLNAHVDLSQVAGRQINLDVQLVGITARTVQYQEIVTVPGSEQQRAAAAIARQSTCPVSGKPLGSMGDPVAVNINGENIYVCCAGCTDTVKSNPSKYAVSRPQITVAAATAADAAAIAAQKTCPVMDEPLGGMGTPVKVMVGEQPIFLCCKGCVKKVQAEPAKYLAMVYRDDDTAAVPAGTEQVREGVFQVVAADSPFIAAQKKCPVMDEPLGTMGGPYKVNAAGKAIYICCPGCAKKIAAEPQRYLAVLKSQGVEAPTIR
ncbi:hypothetical protein [Allorhodopirellula solitaria]|uniref:Putative metal-binding domain of cation transport ATPase n=1 Tax=Allorhodopirellula solitaria TaxID=2527987 RepID=A0A5C5YG26_9BACT|nr:hypothetical protein [Allorhodopirellula solitaria]TWT74048.1 putative metal-binding domain of cation transport ATPase [Allorhodopirellula solitaria]